MVTLNKLVQPAAMLFLDLKKITILYIFYPVNVWLYNPPPPKRERARDSEDKQTHRFPEALHAAQKKSLSTRLA